MRGLSAPSRKHHKIRVMTQDGIRRESRRQNLIRIYRENRRQNLAQEGAHRQTGGIRICPPRTRTDSTPRIRKSLPRVIAREGCVYRSRPLPALKQNLQPAPKGHKSKLAFLLHQYIAMPIISSLPLLLQTPPI